jgi:hypothetical protein
MKLPFNPGRTGLIVAVFVLLFILALATRCHAAGVAVSAGSTVLRPGASALQVGWQWPALQSRDAHFETAITVIAESDFYGAPQRNQFAWSVVYVDGFGAFDIGLGPAFLQNTDAYNSGGANFHLLEGYHRGPWFARWNHFSNMGTKMPNLGRDLILIGRVF